MKKIPNTIYYYFSYSLLPVIGLIQTKVLTTIMPVSTFGEIQLILPMLKWLVLIGGMGAPQFLIRFYSRDGIKVYQESLFVSLLVFLTMGSIASIFTTCFGINYKGLDITARLIMIFLFAVLVQQFIALLQALLRVQERHIFYNMMSICIKLAIAAGSITGVVYWSKYPIEGYLFGSTIVSLSILLLGIALLRIGYVWKLKVTSWMSVKQLIGYGIPIVGILLIADLLPNLNRYVIYAKIESSDVARYTIGYMITSLCFQILYEPLIIILLPRVFKVWELDNKSEVREIITRYLNLYIIIGLIVCGISTRFEDVLVNAVANSNYRLPAGCFTILLLSNFLLGIYRFVSIHYHLKQNTIELWLCFVLSVVVNFTTALLLIEKTELLGAAWSFFLSTVVLTSLVWLRGRNMLRIKLFFRYHFVAFIVSLLLVVIPRVPSWEFYLPLWYFDVVVSFGIAACCAYFLTKVFNKNCRLLIAK